MSTTIDTIVAALNEKLGGSFDNKAKFIVGDEGSIIVDGDGARASDDDAEVTLTVDAETIQSILQGETNPTTAFMTGKLAVEGDMSIAMQLSAKLG